MPQQLIFTNDIAPALAAAIDPIAPSGIFILADSNTRHLVPALSLPSSTPVITIPAGDSNKNLDSLTLIWQALTDAGASRHSLLINLGGGVVTDIGGFAAATFKRGIPFINIPTSLLGAVDAAVGGKTGINFHDIKNFIGVFRPADSVIISSRFFSTLPPAELLSGYAEMIKHALLTSPEALDRLLAVDPTAIDPATLLPLLEESVLVKRHIVDIDPFEKGLRRALNLGHTAGHAFETLALSSRRPIPHGYAVAYGLVTSLVLSHLRLGFPSSTLHRLAAYIKLHYGAPAFTCDDYPALLAVMAQDKKNPDSSSINFTLLSAVGSPVIDSIIPADAIASALDITRDLIQ